MTGNNMSYLANYIFCAMILKPMYTVSINSTKRRGKTSVSKRAMARIIRSSWSAFTSIIVHRCLLWPKNTHKKSDLFCL